MQISLFDLDKELELKPKSMRILYKSLFRGWVEITEGQKERLIKHMNSGIIALSGIKKQKYINNRFLTTD